MPDRITGLQVFVRVAALGSLSAAARSLGMSQTMATKHVAAIEKRLGVRLLHRTTRRLTLTEAGQRYRDAAERMLSDLEEAEAAVAADRLEARGTLRVNIPVSFGVREIAPLLPAFARAYPAVTVELGLNDRMVDLIEEGWDMAVRIGSLADSSLNARKLAPCRMALCAAPSYLAENGTPKTVEELKRHNCLGYTLSRSVGPDRWDFGAGGEVKVLIGGNLRANSGDALVAAAIAGQGIVYQPTFLVSSEIHAGQLVSLQLDHPPFDAPGVFALHPSGRQPPAKVRAFIDFLLKHMAPNPPWDRLAGAQVASGYSS
jgi:DNA-binding transcriptional LysR family regulator